MKTTNIIIIDHVHPILLDELRDYDVRYLPDIQPSALSPELITAEVVVVRSKLRFTKEWIDKAPKLKMIARLGSGMDNIDKAYAKEKGVTCINAPEGNRNAVAEQTVGMMLSLLSNTFKGSSEIGKGIWNRKGNEGLELQNLTVGIIGFGNVGSTLASRLSSFGCKILAYDRFISGYGKDIVHECTLEYLQKNSDIITLHTPLNKFSKNMVNSEFIEGVEKPFFLLNLSRGEVVVIKDLIKGLQSKKILGAALDVLPNEQLDSYSKMERKQLVYLSDNKRVILSPHIGGLTKDSFKKLAEVLAIKIKKEL